MYAATPPTPQNKSSSAVIEVSCVAAVAVAGHQHFSVLIAPEAVEVNQDAGDGIALATVHQVLEGNLEGVFRLHHVKYLILDVLEGDLLLTVEFHLLLNGPKEIVEGEDVEVSVIVHVQKFENILQRRRLLPVFQRQYKVQIGLVVHFSIVGEALLKHSVQKDRGERRCAVARELLFAQHAVVVLIQVEVLAVDPESGRG